MKYLFMCRNKKIYGSLLESVTGASLGNVMLVAARNEDEARHEYAFRVHSFVDCDEKDVEAVYIESVGGLPVIMSEFAGEIIRQNVPLKPIFVGQSFFDVPAHWVCPGCGNLLYTTEHIEAMNNYKGKMFISFDFGFRHCPICGQKLLRHNDNLIDLR